MKNKVICLTILLCLPIMGCSNSNETIVQNAVTPKVQTTSIQKMHNYPQDFNFRLNFNTFGRNQIDTYKETFTKDLVMNGSQTINFKVPDEMKGKIYNKMLELDVMSLPDTLKVEGMHVTPSSDYKLDITMNGKSKTIVWNEGFYTTDIDDMPDPNARFLKLVEFISEYIYSTQEYKGMKPASGGYD